MTTPLKNIKKRATRYKLSCSLCDPVPCFTRFTAANVTGIYNKSAAMTATCVAPAFKCLAKSLPGKKNLKIKYTKRARTNSAKKNNAAKNKKFENRAGKFA